MGLMDSVPKAQVLEVERVNGEVRKITMGIQDYVIVFAARGGKCRCIDSFKGGKRVHRVPELPYSFAARVANAIFYSSHGSK